MTAMAKKNWPLGMEPGPGATETDKEWGLHGPPFGFPGNNVEFIAFQLFIDDLADGALALIRQRGLAKHIVGMRPANIGLAFGLAMASKIRELSKDESS